MKLNGDGAAATLDIDKVPTVGSRIGLLSYEQFNTTSAPTKTHQDVYEIAKEEFEPLKSELQEIIKLLDAFGGKLESAGAPYTPYRLEE